MGCGLVVNLLLLGLLGFLSEPGTAQAQVDTLPQWKSTGQQVSPYVCFDGSQPNAIISSPLNEQTILLNWKTGEKIQLEKFSTFSCDLFDTINGVFFNFTNAGTVRRYTDSEPQGRDMAHFPHIKAKDGSLRYYSYFGDLFKVSGAYDSLVSFGSDRLHISEDAGISWQERGQQFKGKIGSLTMNEGNSKAIYIVVRDGEIAGTNLFRHIIYFSSDAGSSWEKRATLDLPKTRTVFLRAPFGTSTPIDTVLYYEVSNEGAGDKLDLHLSNDGGRTFSNPFYSTTFGISAMDSSVQVFHIGLGLMQVRFNQYQAENQAFYSKDSGQNWTQVKLPTVPNQRIRFMQSSNNPALLVVFNAPGGAGYYSRDGGLNWQKLFDNTFSDIIYLSPYTPTVLLRVSQQGQLETLELPEVDKYLTSPVVPSNSPNAYYQETGLNISPLFLKYWQEQGGLAQFGYPKTASFREINSADGKIYQVQYFERNRFEYHPENAGTRYEVLLGLLGNQQTQERRDKGEMPFKSVAPPQNPSTDVLYFPNTGHSLAYGFKNYWEANGGLTIYGYPTSEEFQEKNPDNGKTYTVQYFERARFEYHPEYAGTKYEVLLGLLGNALLRAKNWL